MLPQLKVITDSYRLVRKLCKYYNAIYSQLHLGVLHKPASQRFLT